MALLDLGFVVGLRSWSLLDDFLSNTFISFSLCRRVNHYKIQFGCHPQHFECARVLLSCGRIVVALALRNLISELMGQT